MKCFSLILVIGAAAIIITIGTVSIVASHGIILALLPAFLGTWAAWIAWVLAIALIIGIQVGECRPFYLAHLHTESRSLYHQGAHPGNAPPDLKTLRLQLLEELGLNRDKQLWVRAFAIAITLVDFVWSCIIFPPFTVGNDVSAIWRDLLRRGLGALNVIHLLLIVANVAVIPLCFMVFLKELSILSSGQRDTAISPTKKEGKAATASKESKDTKESKPDPVPADALPQPVYDNPQFIDPRYTAYRPGVPSDAK